MIKQCTSCGKKPHPQDGMYGQGMRVHNEIKKGDKVEHRCTVCGAGKLGKK